MGIVSTKCECDRCLRPGEAKGGYHPEGWNDYYIHEHPKRNKNMLLCVECQKDLLRWLATSRRGVINLGDGTELDRIEHALASAPELIEALASLPEDKAKAFVWAEGFEVGVAYAKAVKTFRGAFVCPPRNPYRKNEEESDDEDDV